MDPNQANKPDNSLRNKRSKKPTKSYNLTDFIVIKKQGKKSKRSLTKKITAKHVKRGKIKKKKPTTLKKKVLKVRLEKRSNVLDERKTERLIQEIEALAIKEEQTIVHSRNFRDYCDHFTTQDIKHFSEIVIQDLFRYQENKFEQNPVKARANRRYVVGFKEVKKFLTVERLKLIFIAPDLEKNTEIDNLVDEIKKLADEHKTPYIFGLKRRKLGYLLLKKVPVSIVGIFDYQGTTDNVNILLSHLAKEKIEYKKFIK